jgi:serine/threonine protein phosphatase PrpC
MAGEQRVADPMERTWAPSPQLGAASTAGAYGPAERKINQDVFQCGPALTCLCVCDGHGPTGELISASVSTSFSALAPRTTDSKELCERIARNVSLDCGQHATHSGSTMVAAVVRGDSLAVINVGDSRAIARLTSGATVDLSRDHKPDDPEELANIHRAGGRVFRRPGDVARVGGLALSRAFGDLHLASMGVTSVPDTTLTRLDALHFVVLASDGVWDCLPSSQAGELVAAWLAQGQSPTECALGIVRQCRDLWAVDTDEQYCDDITCCVWVFGRHDSASAARAKL